MNSTGMSRALIVCVLCGAPMASAQVLSFTEVSEESGIVAFNHNPFNQPHGHNLSGGAVGDFNNDGWQDLFVISDANRPDRLFMNNGDGTFTERASAWGIANLHYGTSATAADYNGDGWMDISVSSAGSLDGIPRAGENLVYRNNGDGTFSEVAEQLGLANRVNAFDPMCVAFGDYDEDGDLDLFSTAYSTGQQGNRLYRNLMKETGEERFEDVTDEAGLTPHLDRFVSGFAVSFADMERDGILDIVLIADHGTSRYFRGNGDGTFTNATSTVERLLAANGMGIAIGDFDRDGLFDFYASSIEYEGVPNSGNLLYRQLPQGGFEEVGIEMGVNRAGWAWGVLMVDVDHDGYEEILSTQNADTTRARMYKRSGRSGYAQIAEACGFDHFLGGRGFVNFDMDNDGDQDLVVFTSGGFEAKPIGVWRNDLSGPGTNWLRVELDTTVRESLAPGGFGAVVRILSDKGPHMQMIDGGPNHCSSGEHGAHFGLGPVDTLDWVRVEWLDGTSTTIPGVATNQILKVRAPFHPADFNGDDTLDLADVAGFVSAFVGAVPSADLNGDGVFDLADVQTYARWFSGV